VTASSPPRRRGTRGGEGREGRRPGHQWSNVLRPSSAEEDTLKSLIPWRRRIGGALEPFRQELDDLFERFFAERIEGNGGEMIRAWAPRVDVGETDKEFVVKADLPGVGPKDVDIYFRDGALVIKGERKEQHEEKGKNYQRAERFAGQFYREVVLPPGTDPEKITATSSKGVITVTVAKAPQAQAKKIAVQAGD
jgi:HSP20 family protein